MDILVFIVEVNLKNLCPTKILVRQNYPSKFWGKSFLRIHLRVATFSKPFLTTTVIAMESSKSVFDLFSLTFF